MNKFCLLIPLIFFSLSSQLYGEQIGRQQYAVLTKAYQFHEKEQYRESLDLLQPLLARERPSSYAFSYGSLCYGALDEIDKARALLLRAVQLYPEKSTLWYNLGVYQMQVGDFTGAVKSYRTVIELEGEQAAQRVYYHLGFALYRLEKYREAASTITTLTAADSPRKHWLQLEAYCYMAMEQWQRAEAIGLMIVALEPMAVDGWSLLASISMNIEDYASAAAYLEIGGLLAPERAQHATISGLYGVQSAWNEQVHHLEQLGEDPYQLARRLNAASRYQQALEELENDVDPDMEAGLLRGALLFAVGRLHEAVTFLLTVEQLDCNYSSLSLKERKSKKSRRQYRERLRARSLLLAGQILWLDHEWLRARDVFKKLELLSGYEEVGKSLAACMQSLLAEKESVIDLPGIFDPPIVVENGERLSEYNN